MARFVEMLGHLRFGVVGSNALKMALESGFEACMCLPYILLLAYTASDTVDQVGAVA